MKHQSVFTRLTSLVLTLLLALSLAPTALAAATMGNFKKVREYPGFSDVAADAWYANDVRQAYELGIINGKGNGKFDPEGNLTLAEAITMACQVCAIYYGETFTPGGSPWYQNAVTYAIENGIIREGVYGDYTALATRSDLANLFYCIPAEEFPRINRIAWISDIDRETSYYSWIYMLYSAGVLTGSSTGAFQPNNPVKRSEAAAIINRVVLPENRVHASVTTNAPGQVVTGANGNFKISIPAGQDWEVTDNEVDEDGWCFFNCMKMDEEDPALISVITVPKSEAPNATLLSFAETLLEIEQEDGAQLNADYAEEPIASTLFRGMLCFETHYMDESGIDSQVYYLENSTQFYAVTLATLSEKATPAYREMVDIFYTLDIAL